MGSSPPARGALADPDGSAREYRIIPACAGSTSMCLAWLSRSWDHPRLRGEHSTSFGCSVWWPGSSPPARGARGGPATGGRSRRIIPACAGSTLPSMIRRAATQDHPRLRGEHVIRSDKPEAAAGSSPPARGARARSYARKIMTRIIPACAGSTARCCSRDAARWDHPRLRGEHPSRPSTGTSSAGSSPPARGARQRSLRNARRDRIIPACAGSTWSTPARARSRRDHPRLRGEHYWLPFPTALL